MSVKAEPQKVDGLTPLERATRERRVGLWLIARTPTTKTYKCACSLGRRCGKRCWCAGRTDWQTLPAHCCARPTEQTNDPAALAA